jgi:hypothetical protein
VLVSSSGEWMPLPLHDLVWFLPLQSAFGYWRICSLPGAVPIQSLGSPVVRLDFCMSARDRRPAEVRARFIFPVILGCLLAPSASLGGLEPRVRTVSWVCVIWRAMRKQVNPPGALFLRMKARVVADQNLSGFGQITVDVMGC